MRFACIRRGDQVELHVSDDGRGLALHKLYEKGVAAGIFNATERPERMSEIQGALDHLVDELVHSPEERLEAKEW